MKESPIKLFVIVVTYKGKQWYDRCFTSLRNSTIPVQTIVVDNASNDGTVEYIKENYPEIILIESKENLGFGKGNNLAMKYAYEHGCDYVFLLNQDAWLDRDDTLEKLVSLSKKYPEYGIVSPMHLDAEKKSLNMALELGNNKCSMRMLSDLFCGELKDLYQTNYINAAAWLLPRKTLNIVGGFDPIFKHYEEDDNYLNRVLYHRPKVGICPHASVVHDHHDSPQSNEKHALREQQNLLVVWTNLNVPFSCSRYWLHYFSRFLKYSVLGKSNKARSMLKAMSIMQKSAKQVRISRRETTKIQSSWLLD